jgi:hypothetical protein
VYRPSPLGREDLTDVGLDDMGLIGDLTAAEALAHGQEVVPAVIDLTKLSAHEILTRLHDAPQNKFLRRVFINEWPDLARELNSVTVATARDDGLRDKIVQITKLDARVVRYVLDTAGGNTHIANAFAWAWPGRVDADHREEAVREGLRGMSVKSIRDYDLFAEVARLSGRTEHEVRSLLNAPHGRSLLKNVMLGEAWLGTAPDPGGGRAEVEDRGGERRSTTASATDGAVAIPSRLTTREGFKKAALREVEAFYKAGGTRAQLEACWVDSDLDPEPPPPPEAVKPAPPRPPPPPVSARARAPEARSAPLAAPSKKAAANRNTPVEPPAPRMHHDPVTAQDWKDAVIAHASQRAAKPMPTPTVALPPPLLDAYRDRRLAVLFGSGLSLGVPGNFPRWDELPHRFLDHVASQGVWDQKRIDAKRGSFPPGLPLEEMLSELDVIKTALKRIRKYQAALNAVFRPTDAAPGDVHRALVALDVAVLATTNYDQLLEHAEGSPVRAAYTWKDSDKAFSDVGENRKVLFKIHGSAEHEDSVVMTRREYDEAARDASYRRIMSHLLQERTFLLVGYGINDPLDLDFVFGLNAGAFGVAARTHYALMHKSVSQTDRDRWQREMNIQVVEYDDHRDLPAILRVLAKSPRNPP